MTAEKLYFRVPFEKGHAHFYDTIESFPGLQAGPSFEDRDKYLRDTIRYQLLTTTPEQARRCMFILIQWWLWENVLGITRRPMLSFVYKKSFQELHWSRQQRNWGYVSDSLNIKMN
jgi:hypothetical protein